MLILGSDDSGRGPIIGPMVLAGVLIHAKDEAKLRKLGVKDSKKLTPRRREILAKEIEKHAVDFSVLKIEPQEIDGRSAAGLNLNKLEAIKFAQIINDLVRDAKKNEGIKIVVDCPSTNIEKWQNYLLKHLEESVWQQVGKNIQLCCEHKADVNHVACAAASILAKVTRDAEIAKLKKKLKVNLGSLPYDEEILLEVDKKIRVEKIGNLSKIQNKKIKIFSFDPNTQKISKYKITKFFKHKKNQIYEVNLQWGKNIKLTTNHPLFVLTEKLDISTKNLEQIKLRDFIAVASNINTNSNLRYINLLKYLLPFSNINSPIYVEGRFIDDLLIKNFEKIQKISRQEGYARTAVYQWYKPIKKYIPLHLLVKLIKKRKTKNLKNLYVHSREGPKLPINLKLTNEFLWFLGIYIAEGWVTRDKVMISATDKKIINQVMKFAKKFDIGYYIRKDEIGLNSVLLTKLIKGFNLGGNAYIKRVPDFAFSLKPAYIKKILEGVYEGDGYIHDGLQEIETYSRELAKQLQWLELLCGNFTSFHKRKSRGGCIIRVLSKSSNSLSPDNVPSIIGNYLKEVRLKKRLSFSILSKKTEIDKRALWAIENKKVNCINKKTLNRLNRIYKDKKLSRLLDSEIYWVRVNSIRKTNRVEEVYDLEVRPNGKMIENFLGGEVGIILHNSGYPSDPITRKFLEDYGKKHKKDGIFRETWATWKNHIARKEQVKLDEF